MTDEHRDIETIFHEAGLIADHEERDSFLIKACGPDETLRARIEKLFAAEPQMGSFLADKTAATPAHENDSAASAANSFSILKAQ